MQADFSAAWQALLGNEGGYVDNPADPGGATMYGVTERVARAHGYTGDMRELPLAMAEQIAKTEYWDPYRCDQMPQEVAFQILDTAYNGGHPAQWVQQAAGVTADGIIGPQTLAAINAADPDKIVMRFDAARIDYLTDCNPWPTFGRGWMHRIANNLRRAAS
jgi:lysozyme family protein